MLLHLQICQWRSESACMVLRQRRQTCVKSWIPHMSGGRWSQLGDRHDVCVTEEIRGGLPGGQHQQEHHFLRAGEKKEAAVCGEERPLQRPAR